ncbi:MAG: HEAT repeat domain-containing protein [Planctomycetaceae bacterium]
MEKQLLPDPQLASAYESAVWLYVYRDFSGSDADRAAERICLRLGMTSFPQHLLVDPATLEILGDTGRSVESFLAAVGRARREPGAGGAAARVEEAEKRAAALEKSGSVAAARRALDDPDIVVRFRALQILASKEPQAVAERAEAHLRTPNDPFRFEVCRALRKSGDAKAAPFLEALLARPESSLNPNVLRIEAAGALGACGSAGSIEALAPFAASGDHRNGLTGAAIDAIAAIAGRDAQARRLARDALREAYPPPPKEEPERRMVEALAKRVHAALEGITGKRVPFPAVYDPAARAKLLKSW